MFFKHQQANGGIAVNNQPKKVFIYSEVDRPDRARCGGRVLQDAGDDMEVALR